MDPTDNIGYLLQHITAVLAKQSDQTLQERLGIGFSQYKILMVLQYNPNSQQKVIADSLGQTEASISRQIGYMLDSGLVNQKVSPRNRREHLTSITPRGVRLADEANNTLNNYHLHMFESLGEKKQEQLETILKLMHQFTCQPGKTGACRHPFKIL